MGLGHLSTANSFILQKDWSLKCQTATEARLHLLCWGVRGLKAKGRVPRRSLLPLLDGEDVCKTVQVEIILGT